MTVRGTKQDRKRTKVSGGAAATRSPKMLTKVHVVDLEEIMIEIVIMLEELMPTHRDTEIQTEDMTTEDRRPGNKERKDLD